MSYHEAVNFDELLYAILEATADKPQTATVEKANARSIGRMVRQCYALLRQQLEHKARSEPNLYDRDQMERVLKNFEIAIPDIEDAVATRVLDGVSELIRQEIRRVLQDALSDLENVAVDSVSEEERRDAGPAARASPSQQPPEELPVLEVEGREGAAPERVAEPREPSAPPQEPAVDLPSRPDVHSAVDEPERQHADTPLSARGTVQEHPETAEDKVYEGDVKVVVDTRGGAKQMLRFLDQIQGNPQLRMLRMVGNDQSATVWLALRQPMHLKELLYQMPDVSDVRVSPARGSGGPEQVLDVVLGGLPEPAR